MRGFLVTFTATGFIVDVPHTRVLVDETGPAKGVGCELAAAGLWRLSRQHRTTQDEGFGAGSRLQLSRRGCRWMRAREVVEAAGGGVAEAVVVGEGGGKGKSVTEPTNSKPTESRVGRVTE